MKINRLIIINAAENYRALNKIIKGYGNEYFDKYNDISNSLSCGFLTGDEYENRIDELNEEFKLFRYAYQSRKQYRNVLKHFGVERYMCSSDEIKDGCYNYCEDINDILEMHGNIIDDERPLYYEDFKDA